MLFLDSSNPDEIREIQAWGVISGVTTNPLIMSREAPDVDLEARIRQVVAVSQGHVSVELTCEVEAEMLSEALVYHAWAPDRICIKVPFSEVGLRVLHQLSRRGIATNATCMMSFNQAYLAALAGATYVSIFSGRVRDMGYDVRPITRTARAVLDREGFAEPDLDRIDPASDGRDRGARGRRPHRHGSAAGPAQDAVESANGVDDPRVQRRLEKPPPLMPTLRVRPSRPLLGCMAGTWLVAFTDTLLAGAGSSVSRVVGAWLAAAFAIAVGLGLGVLVWLMLELALRWQRGAALGRRLSALLDRENPERTEIVRLHAQALALSIALGLFTAAQLLMLDAIFRLQIEQVAIALACVGSVIAVIAAATVGLLSARWLVSPLAAVDRRIRLPVPGAAWARYLIYVALPAWLTVFGLRLGVTSLPARIVDAMLLGSSLITAPLLLLIWGRFGPRNPAWRRRLELLSLAVAALLPIDGVIATRRTPAWLGSVQSTSLGGLGLSWLTRLSDFDRDGASHWVGQIDCAPFDRDRGPFALDLPANGRDENCDGSDAQKRPTVTPLFSGKLPPARVRRYNVVWIIVDGVRADRLGYTGYKLPTTPQLDLLAREAVVFTRAYAQSSATLYSFSSMFTGLDPAALQYRVQFGRPQLDDTHVTLAERFAAEGYETAISLTAWTQRYYAGLQQGMKTRLTSAELDSKGRASSQQTSPLVTIQAIQQIERALHAKKPFFSVVYYHDTHMPYYAHPGQPSFGASATAAYDGEIAFVDRHIGVLLAYLKYRATLWNDTILVVTSDHGEEFGEHGSRHHARTCYVESTHVPLLLRVPAQAPRRVETPVALVDLAPTLLELTGIAPGGMSLEGQSLLVSLLSPEKLTPNRPIFCAVASQWQKDEVFFRRSVRAGPYAAIEDLVAGRIELYDTRTDPREQRNLAAEPALSDSLAELRGWLGRTRTGNMTSSW